MNPGARLESPQWRMLIAGPLVALVTLVAALITTNEVGLPVRDPDNVAALYLGLVGFAMALLVVLDIFVRAGRRTHTSRPSRAAMASVRRDRWTASRGLLVASALVSFYVSYMAYRNLKSVVPLLRPGEIFDSELADLDRSLFLGHDPAELMHAALGTQITTHVLSTAYVAFIVFLPLSLALALVFSRDIRAGVFYATALSINWILGAGSYFLLPSLGPIYADPGLFAALPTSEVTHLQAILLEQRVDFLRDPAAHIPQAIAAFASLHISMSLTAAVAAHLLGLGRRLKIALWVWFALTVASTIFLGWHYVLDDVGGVVIAVLALGMSRALTGIDLRSARRPRPAPSAGAGSAYNGGGHGGRPAEAPAPAHADAGQFATSAASTASKRS